MKIKTYDDFEKVINKQFLDRNIKDMIRYNIPFPHTLITLISSHYFGLTVESIYIYKTQTNNLWLEAFKHIGQYYSDEDNFYEIEFKILLDYVDKIPKFKELINL